MKSAAILTKYEEIPSTTSNLLRFKACKITTTSAGNVRSRNMEFENRLL